MPAEPSMPPTGSTNWVPQRQHRLRGSERLLLFSKALLRDYFLGVHTPELSTAFSSLMSTLPQLLTQRAELLSQLQSWYCPASMEALALNAQQLNHWDWPHRFLFFILACGEVGLFTLVVVHNSTGTLQEYSAFKSIKTLVLYFLVK